MLSSLFWSFLSVGSVAFGGGWAVVGIIEREIAANNLLVDTRFTDLLAISQMTPGPIALNVSTLTGLKSAGPLGAVVATVALLTVPLLITILVVVVHRKTSIDHRPLVAALGIGSTALIGNTLIHLGSPLVEKPLLVVIAVLALFLGLKFKVRSLYLMVGGGIVSLVAFFITNGWGG